MEKDTPKDIVWIKVGNYFKKMSGFVNILANFSGALFITIYFTFFDNISVITTSLVEELMVPVIMTVFLVFMGVAIYRKWAGDIERFIQLKSTHRDIDPALFKAVQKKILNLPFTASITSMFNWGLAAIIMSSVLLLSNGFSNLTIELWFSVFRVFTGIIMGGIVTSAMVFFLMENFCRNIIPHFFPAGGLASVKGVFRLSLRLRILLTFVFASFIPMLDLALLFYLKAREMMVIDPEIVLSSLGFLILFVLFVDLSLAIILSQLLSRVIVKPVTEMKNAMAKVEKGNLATFLKVSDNNELGVLADNFNKMTEGLRDRYQIRRSLALAGEVQQGLLPDKDPEIQGLDIAGKIIYSDETGGDYYDYIYPTDPGEKKIGIVIGDVSDHGISSALLMASTRAFMRQRVALSGSIADIVTDVNFQFSRDVEDSGRFMTLFFLSVEYGRNTLDWVRAGHEPAILYDSLTDCFEELKGTGIALGIDGDFQYTSYEKKEFKKGQVLILATDGLWEAINSKGEMFGKKRIRKIIKENQDKSSARILDTIMESVEEYIGSKTPDDDMTLVIVKRE